MKYKVDGESELLLFHQNKSEKGISRHTEQKIVKNAAIRAKLSENVSRHWLRHAHAPESLLSGDDLAVIQKTLGHISISTTVKYTKVFSEQTSGKKFTK